MLVSVMVVDEPSCRQQVSSGEKKSKEESALMLLGVVERMDTRRPVMIWSMDTNDTGGGGRRRRRASSRRGEQIFNYWQSGFSR